MENKPAVIVARVSTDQQAEKGYSLPTQLAAMRQYAAKLGRPVQEEITDDCSGAIPIAERPGGKRLYALADSGQIGMVIFYTLDRTARDERVLEYLLLKSYLHDRGIELHYTDTGLDPYTMEGNLVGYIKAHAAADERRKIAERSSRGRHAKARAGQWVGTGYAAFGYRREGNGMEARIVIDEAEAAIVRSIFEWFTLRGLSLRGIASRLITERVPSPNHSSRSVEKWRPETIRAILKNEIYIGKVYYGKTRIVNKRRVKRPPEEWTLAVDTPHLAIIDPQTYEAAQERLKQNKYTLSCQNARHEYLLTGFFRCGVCGSAMNGGFMREVYSNGNIGETLYYRCATRGRLDRIHNGKRISCRKVDTLVWNWLLESTTPEKLEKGLREWRENDDTRLGQVRALITNIAKQEATSERAIKRLAATVKNLEDEAEDAAAALEAELRRENAKLADLRAERAEQEAELSKVELTPPTGGLYPGGCGRN